MLTIITTNSYAIVPYHIGQERFETDALTLAKRAGFLAKNAVNNAQKGKIAGSIPPLFGSYRPDLFDKNRAYAIAKPLIDGLGDFADIWLLETQSSIAEPTTIIDFLPHDRPIWVSFTLDDNLNNNNPYLRSGETVETAVSAMLALNAPIGAILFNCSQPEIITHALQITADIIGKSGQTVQFGAYANAFKPQNKTGEANEQIDELRDDLHPLGYLEWATTWANMGANIIGGCCGIGVEHIQVLYDKLKNG